jgi:hypothetical protein
MLPPSSGSKSEPRKKLAKAGGKRERSRKCSRRVGKIGK